MNNLPVRKRMSKRFATREYERRSREPGCAVAEMSLDDLTEELQKAKEAPDEDYENIASLFRTMFVRFTEHNDNRMFQARKCFSHENGHSCHDDFLRATMPLKPYAPGGTNDEHASLYEDLKRDYAKILKNRADMLHAYTVFLEEKTDHYLEVGRTPADKAARKGSEGRERTAIAAVAKANEVADVALTCFEQTKEALHAIPGRTGNEADNDSQSDYKEVAGNDFRNDDATDDKDAASGKTAAKDEGAGLALVAVIANSADAMRSFNSAMGAAKTEVDELIRAATDSVARAEEAARGAASAMESAWVERERTRKRAKVTGAGQRAGQRSPPVGGPETTGRLLENTLTEGRTMGEGSASRGQHWLRDARLRIAQAKDAADSAYLAYVQSRR